MMGVTPTVEDRRVRPYPSVIIFSRRPQLVLDPHQEKAVEEALAACRGTLYYPTGTGKSAIMGEVIRRLRVPTLVLVPTKVIQEQLHDALEQATGAPVGLMGDGKWDAGADLVVATFQSIARRLKGNKGMLPSEKKRLKEATLRTLEQYHCVVADEGHHIEAATFELVMKALPNAYYRYAFSATPFKGGRAEDRETLLRVQGWAGPVASYLSIAGGVETGRIVPADVPHQPRPEALGPKAHQLPGGGGRVHRPQRRA